MPLILDPVQSGYNLSVINDNFQKIESTWDEKLDRLVSTQPNQMEQELDMNSYRILNTPAPTEPTDVVRLKELEQLAIDSGAVGVTPILQPRQIGDGVTTVFGSPNTEDVAPVTMFVNIDGVSQRPYTDFNILGAGQLQFNEAPPLNSEIDITYFEPRLLEDGSETIKVVNNVAEMKGAAWSAGDRLETKNYYSTQLGGGAEYLFKTFAQATADGDVYSPTSTGNIQCVNGVAVLQIEGWAIPVKFGVTLGIQTDPAIKSANTLAYQECIDSGHPVCMSDGVHHTSSALSKGDLTTGSRDFSLIGISAKSIIRNEDSNVFEMLTGFGTFTHNVRLSWFTIDGVDKSNGFTGINWENIQFSFMEGVTVRNIDTCVRMASCFSNTVDECTFEDANTGLLGDRRSVNEGSLNQLKLTKSYIKSCITGVNIVRLGANNLIEWNEFNDCTTGILQGDTGLALTARKNFFEGGLGRDIQVNSSLSFPCASFKFVDNYFGRRSAATTIPRIDLKGIEGASITDNTFKSQFNNEILCTSRAGVTGEWKRNKQVNLDTVLQDVDQQSLESLGSLLETDVNSTKDLTNLIPSAGQVFPLTGWSKFTGGSSTLQTEKTHVIHKGLAFSAYHMKAQRFGVSEPTLQHTISLPAVSGNAWRTLCVVARAVDSDSEFRIGVRVEGGGGLVSSALVKLTNEPVMYCVSHLFSDGETPELLIIPGDTDSETNPAGTFSNNLEMIVAAAVEGKGAPLMDDLLFASSNVKAEGSAVQRLDGSVRVLSIDNSDSITATPLITPTF